MCLLVVPRSGVYEAIVKREHAQTAPSTAIRFAPNEDLVCLVLGDDEIGIRPGSVHRIRTRGESFARQIYGLLVDDVSGSEIYPEVPQQPHRVMHVSACTG